MKAAKADLVNMLNKPVKDTTRAKSTAMKALQDVESIKQKIKDTANFAKAQEQMKQFQKGMGKPADDSGPIGKAHGDRPVELDHRRRVEPAQSAVQLGDLRPVGGLGIRSLDLQGGDRGL